MADIKVGDTVDVPGGMYGVVKFTGEVHGKKGTFAGVQLAQEFASKGRNNGDVDGQAYTPIQKIQDALSLTDKFV